MFSMKLLFNNFFQSITKNLDLFEWHGQMSQTLKFLTKLSLLLPNFALTLRLLNWIKNFPIKKWYLNRIRKNSNEAAGGDVSLKPIKKSTFFLPHLEHCVNEDLVKSEHSTQYVLTRLIQTLKIGLDNSGLVGTILTDLSKAYDCLPHDLLIAKLEAYGLDKPSLYLVNG